MLSVSNLHRPGLVSASFDLADGECLAVRGPSGAGKTLLLRALADLDPNDGDVTLDGRSRAEMPAPQWRRLVTYVPAGSGWWADTVGAHFADWPTAAPLLEAFGLTASSRHTLVQTLSTGERQRFALIRALVQQPRVVLLDEPTSGLDTEASAAVEAEVARRLAQGVSAIWVTHDAAQAERVARRCLKVERGRVTEVPL